MGGMFDAGGKPLLALSKIFDILLLSFLFFVCCIPVVTIGPALCALYYTCRKVVMERKGYLVREYFGCFGRNFVQAFCAWMVLLVLMVLMGINIFYASVSWSGVLRIGAMAVYFAVLFVAVIFTGYIFPMLSRFECKGKQLFSNAMVLSVQYPGTTVLLFVLLVFLYGGMAYSFAAMPYLLFVLPVAFAWLQQRLLERIFEKYIEE